MPVVPFVNELLVGIALAVIVIVLIQSREDNFNSRREKASAINNWWKSNKDPSYADYKKSLNDSDIVEYSKIKAIAKTGGLSVGAIENVIG